MTEITTHTALKVCLGYIRLRAVVCSPQAAQRCYDTNGAPNCVEL